MFQRRRVTVWTRKAARPAVPRAIPAVVLVGVLSLPVVLPAVIAQQRADTALASLADGTTDVAATQDAVDPDVSADGQVVAFTSRADNLDPDAPANLGDGQNVYVRDLDRGTTELVSLDPDGQPFVGDASQPSVSGDGNVVAFTADSRPRAVEVTGSLELDRVVYAGDADGGGLFVTTVDGLEPRAITGTTAGDASPTVSPDGQRVAFVRDGDLWSVDLDGGSPTQLTSTDDVVESDPAWSPDGVRLLHVFDDSSPEPEMSSIGLGIVDLSTGEDEVLSIPGSPQAIDDPAWAPDALRIAVGVDDPTAGPRVFTASLDPESGLGTLAPVGIGPPGLAAERSPAWSPDGQWLAFVREFDEGEPEVHVVVPGPQSLSSPVFVGSDPVPADLAWSADGDWILVDGRDGDTGQLHRIGVDDGEVSQPMAALDVPAPPTTAALEPAVAPTQLGPDTPLTVRAAVRSRRWGDAAPTGPVEMRVCPPAGTTFGCFSGTPVAPPVPLVADADDPTVASAALTTSAQMPPVAFDALGEWCWELAYLGGGRYDRSADSNPGRLCHEVTKSQPAVDVDVSASSYFGTVDATISVSVVGGDGFASGIVTLWRCGPDTDAPVTAAGCPAGGVRVDDPVALDDGEATFQHYFDPLPAGRHCWRAEYAGSGGFQRALESGPAHCFTLLPDDEAGGTDSTSLGIDAAPGGIDHGAPQAPGVDASAEATPGFADVEAAGAAAFFLCGPDEVTRHGCETGGTPVAAQVTSAGEFGATASAVRPAVTAEGVHCWRLEVEERAYTDGDASCFAVSAGYDGAPAPGGIDVYVRDRAAGTTRIVSLTDSGEVPESRDSSQPSIADDGTRVAFTSTSPLVDDDALYGEHVFVRDLAAGTTTWVSVSECFGSDCWSPGSHSPAISGDGSAVAFLTASWQVQAYLPDGSEWDGASGDQVLVRDLAAARTTVESVDAEGGPAFYRHESPSISADGSRVAFVAEGGFSEGPSALAVTSPGVWLRDRAAATSELVSATVDGGPLAGYQPFVLDAAISGDGRLVAFASNARNLVADDPCADSTEYGCGPSVSVFTRDVELDTTRIESVRSDGERPMQGSWNDEVAVDGNGGTIAFTSDAPDLVDGVELAPELEQVYVRLRPSGLRIEPDPIDLGARPVGGAPATATVTVTAEGGRPVTITDVTLGGPHAADFTVAGDCAGTTLAAGGSCSVEVTFVPGAAGPRTAVLTVSDADAGVQASADLTGEGIAGEIVVDPTDVDFGARDVGETSPPETVTVRNTGTDDVAITGTTLGGADPGAFLVDDGCAGTSLAPAATCAIEVRHRPPVDGAQAAVLVVTHDAGDSPETVRLSGEASDPTPGDGALTVTPDPVDFGVVPLDTTTVPRIVTVTNTGDASVAVDDFTLTGAGAARFTPVVGNDTCSGATLEPGRGCGIAFALDASATGAPVATLQVNSDAAEPANPVPLRALVPLLEIDPTLGPPGFVPEVTGRFFPPDTDVELSWEEGLGVTDVRTDADGRLRARVLVFHRDRIGPRLAVASGAGEERWATAEFLVVPGSLQPGDFTTRG